MVIGKKAGDTPFPRIARRAGPQRKDDLELVTFGIEQVVGLVIDLLVNADNGWMNGEL